MHEGTNSRFWEEQWLGNYSLKEKFPALFKISTQQVALIATMGWFEGHLWKWALVWKRELGQEEWPQAEELMAVLLDHHPLPNQEDIVHWKGKRHYTARDPQKAVYMELVVEVERKE